MEVEGCEGRYMDEEGSCGKDWEKEEVLGIIQEERCGPSCGLLKTMEEPAGIQEDMMGVPEESVWGDDALRFDDIIGEEGAPQVPWF
jgi:hypothetical protein